MGYPEFHSVLSQMRRRRFSGQNNYRNVQHSTCLQFSIAVFSIRLVHRTSHGMLFSPASRSPTALPPATSHLPPTTLPPDATSHPPPTTLPPPPPRIPLPLSPPPLPSPPAQNYIRRASTSHLQLRVTKGSLPLSASSFANTSHLFQTFFG